MPKPFIWNHFLRGILANIEESRTWKWNSGKFERGKSHLLCPVIWCSLGGWILIMKRAITLSFDEWEKYDQEHSIDISQHKKHFGGDDSMSNYGFIGGRIVKIDYGDLNDFWGEDFKDQE